MENLERRRLVAKTAVATPDRMLYLIILVWLLVRLLDSVAGLIGTVSS
jgi:hypothetical protein